MAPRTRTCRTAVLARLALACALFTPIAAVYTTFFSEGVGGVRFDLGRAETDALFRASGAFARFCPLCDDSHSQLFYVRATPVPPDWSLYETALETWHSRNNTINEDFHLYDNVADVCTRTNAWQYCNYDDPDIGFPRDCAKYPNSSTIMPAANQWFSLVVCNELAWQSQWSIFNVSELCASPSPTPSASGSPSIMPSESGSVSATPSVSATNTATASVTGIVTESHTASMAATITATGTTHASVSASPVRITSSPSSTSSARPATESTARVFTYTGSFIEWNITAELEKFCGARVSLWGAGGGGGLWDQGPFRGEACGGGGAYVSGFLLFSDLPPVATSVPARIIIGKGGGTSFQPYPWVMYAPVDGGGGEPKSYTEGHAGVKWTAGQGGGRTTIQLWNGTAYEDYVTAGGGGGGAAWNSLGCRSIAGAGGLLAGMRATFDGAPAYHDGGGTQCTGGIAFRSWGPPVPSVNGSKGLGGSNLVDNNSGGGGGGWFGGAAGLDSPASGGSSFYGMLYGGANFSEGGSGWRPGGLTLLAAFGDVGMGGNWTANAGHGAAAFAMIEKGAVACSANLLENALGWRRPGLPDCS